MLKGCLFQELHPKWQRKFSATKTGETFNGLYDRACIVERQEKQTAAARSDAKTSTKLHAQASIKDKG